MTFVRDDMTFTVIYQVFIFFIPRARPLCYLLKMPFEKKSYIETSIYFYIIVNIDEETPQNVISFLMLLDK